MAPSDLHIWYTFTSRLDEQDRIDACRAVLGTAEREQYTAFLRDRDRHDYLVAHALVRTVLSNYVDVPPSAWRFETNEYGRPFIHPDHQAPPIQFNLSHTRGLVACAVTLADPVGIDVERIDTVVDPRVADRVFAPSEVKDLRAVRAAEQGSRFADYWTLKEAYIKARGEGLSVGLENVSFQLLPEESPIRVRFADSLSDDPYAWQFALWSPSSDYRAALAVRTGRGRPAPVVQFHDVVPFGEAVGVSPALRVGPRPWGAFPRSKQGDAGVEKTLY